MESFIAPVLIFVTYGIVSALHRLWSFEIHYNFNQAESETYLSNKEYLLSVLQSIFKCFYVDLDGRRYPRVRAHLSDVIPPERLESIFNWRRPYALLIMVFSLLLFLFFIGVTFSSAAQYIWGPFFAPLFKVVAVLLGIFAVGAIVYNAFDYFAYKTLVVYRACQDYLTRIKKNKENNEVTEHLPDKITYAIEMWTGYPRFGDPTRKSRMAEEIKTMHQDVLDEYTTKTTLINQVNQKGRLDNIVWNILGFLFTHREGLSYIVLYTVFALIVANSFGLITLLTNFSEPETPNSTKQALGHVAGRLTALGLGSLAIVLCYLAVIWLIYMGVQYIGRLLLENLGNAYKSEKDEFEFDTEKNEWVKTNDYSHTRHIVNMFCLLLKKDYAKVKKEDISFIDEEGNTVNTITFTDFKALDVNAFAQHFHRFDFNDFKKAAYEVFWRKISYPTIILYVTAFFVIMMFVIWYESYPQRHQPDRHHVNARSILDGSADDLDEERITKRVKRYTYLYETFIVITGIIIGCIVIYNILLQKESLVISEEVSRFIYKSLLNVAVVSVLVCVFTFFLFYET